MPQGRTQTMTSPSSMSQAQIQRQLPPRSPSNFNMGGLNGSMVNGAGGPNGYYAGQRQPSNSNQVQTQPQPQYLPAPARNDRRPYPTPQRVDPRGQQGSAMPAPQQQYPASRPAATRYYSNNGPALTSDLYPSQPMVSTTRPQMYQPPSSSFAQAPSQAFRQAPYESHASRQTAQGRIVPKRQDERAMSMMSYSQQLEYQTMGSGRIIPNRRTSLSGPPTAPEGIQPAISNGFNSLENRPLPNNMNGKASMASTQVAASRTMSMSSVITSSDIESLQQRSSAAESLSSRRARNQNVPKAPLVYPALLSRVGYCFRDKVNVGTRIKNNLEYKHTFSGSEAVDVISYIIKTTDRNLALLLGRALDAQKFFHDVTYDHRLRDSPSEIYQFRETLMDEPSDAPEVNGVFVLLTECYSPTCTPSQLCYSIACPRRLEQQSRLNLKPQPGLRREKSQASLYDADETDEQKLWINTVSQEIADSVGDREKKRQEVISEIMYTERDFVKDLEYLRDFWILPLRHSNPAAPSTIPESRKDRIVSTIFSNIIDRPSIHGVSSRFAETLTERQRKHPVVQCVGDIFLDFVPQFEPFVIYGSNQLVGKFEFEKERSLNHYFSKFVDETERKKESRKLELNGYLTKPTTRLARYPLLLENVLKYTDPSSQDMQNIPKAIQMIRDLLTRVNAESGKAENRFNLRQLHEQLRFRPIEHVDLKLTDDNRELIYKGTLKKSPTDPSDIQAYLFDHAVVLVRVKIVGKKEELRVYKKVSFVLFLNSLSIADINSPSL
jgi:RHO1 GDP-GTP exchange protein 1/2